jgi:hypothetical protein
MNGKAGMAALTGAGNFAIHGPRCILMHCDGDAADSTLPISRPILSADPCLEDLARAHASVAGPRGAPFRPVRDAPDPTLP